MRPSPDAAVLGDALLDVRVVPATARRRGADVPASIELGAGGQGANVAIRLARRGLRVRLHCALGDDPAARIVREALAVEALTIEAAPTDRTGTVVLLLDADGERTMLSHRAPLLPRTLADDAAWTIVSGYVLLEEGELRVGGEGRRAVVGCALPDAAAGGWWRRAGELRPHLVVLNADEARAIGSDAQTLARESGGLVVVTEGGGADAALPDGTIRRVTARRLPAVDTTGAGDAFASTMVAELLGVDWPPAASVVERALESAATAAAQVSLLMGAQAPIAAEHRPMPA